MNDDFFERERRRLDAQIAEELRRIDSVMKVVCYAAFPVAFVFAAIIIAIACRTAAQ